MSDIVDLSVKVDGSTLGPPAAGSPPAVFETVLRGPGHWQSSRMAALLHTGSHVDAPLHCVAGGAPIADVDLDRVIGEAAVVDLTDVGEREAIGAGRLERAGAEILAGDIVVLRTDWSDRTWGRFPDYYVGSPFLTREGAAWVAEHEPRAVVFDFFFEECAGSPDFTSEDFVAHRELLGRGIPLVEQATGIGRVGRPRFTIAAPFVRLGSVEAAPCRILALVPEGNG